MSTNTINMLTRVGSSKKNLTDWRPTETKEINFGLLVIECKQTWCKFCSFLSNVRGDHWYRSRGSMVLFCFIIYVRTMGRPKRKNTSGVHLFLLKACKPGNDDGTIEKSENRDMYQMTIYWSDRKAGNCNMNSAEAHIKKWIDRILCNHFCDLRREGCRYMMKLMIKREMTSYK